MARNKKFADEKKPAGGPQPIAVEKQPVELTFGFEIEGRFDLSLVKHEILEGGEWKHDGSVHTRWRERSVFAGFGDDREFDCGCEDDRTLEDRLIENPDLAAGELCENCESMLSDMAQEYASPIYESYDEMLKALALFTSEAYEHNETCGLHIHVGAKPQKNSKGETLWSGGSRLYSAFSSWKTYQFLQKELMENACLCLIERLGDQEKCPTGKNRFARYNQQRDHLRHFLGESDKYKFMYYHRDTGTIEFRYLAPCRHKLANAKRLCELVTELANLEAGIQTAKQAIDEIEQAAPRPAIVECVGGLETTPASLVIAVDLTKEADAPIMITERLGSFKHYGAGGRGSSGNIFGVNRAFAAFPVRGQDGARYIMAFIPYRNHHSDWPKILQEKYSIYSTRAGLERAIRQQYGEFDAGAIPNQDLLDYALATIHGSGFEVLYSDNSRFVWQTVGTEATEKKRLFGEGPTIAVTDYASTAAAAAISDYAAASIANYAAYTDAIANYAANNGDDLFN